MGKNQNFPSPIEIINNTIQNNLADSPGGGGIFIFNGVTATISNNIILSNDALWRGGGIASEDGGFGSSAIISISNNTFGENTTLTTTLPSRPFGGGAIFIGRHTIATINENVIQNNSAPTISAILSEGISDMIVHNTIAGNTTTDDTTITAAISFRTQSIFNNNNLINNSSLYELWNENPSGSPSLDVENNWWNTINSSEIENKIYDFFDNGNLGIVDYNPYLLEPDSIAPVVSVNDYENVIPSKYSLFQNYPNPFNPSTKIRYKVTELSFVTLKVYDVLGSEIATLFNEEKSAGSYEVKFDATGLTSGVYFYRIISGSYSDTKKMILLK